MAQTRWRQWLFGQKFHAMKRVKYANAVMWEARCNTWWESETPDLRRPKDGDPPKDEQCKSCLKKLEKT